MFKLSTTVSDLTLTLQPTSFRLESCLKFCTYTLHVSLTVYNEDTWELDLVASSLLLFVENDECFRLFRH